MSTWDGTLGTDEIKVSSESPYFDMVLAEIFDRAGLTDDGKKLALRKAMESMGTGFATRRCFTDDPDRRSESWIEKNFPRP